LSPTVQQISQSGKLVGSFPAFALASPASVIGSRVNYHKSPVVTISRFNRLLITLIHHVDGDGEVVDFGRT